MPNKPTAPKQLAPTPHHKGRWSAAAHVRCGGVKRDREQVLARRFATGIARNPHNRK